jgi:hypothetical protein
VCTKHAGKSAPTSKTGQEKPSQSSAQEPLNLRTQHTHSKELSPQVLKNTPKYYPTQRTQSHSDDNIVYSVHHTPPSGSGSSRLICPLPLAFQEQRERESGRQIPRKKSEKTSKAQEKELFSFLFSVFGSSVLSFSLLFLAPEKANSRVSTTVARRKSLKRKKSNKGLYEKENPVLGDFLPFCFSYMIIYALYASTFSFLSPFFPCFLPLFLFLSHYFHNDTYTKAHQIEVSLTSPSKSKDAEERGFDALPKSASSFLPSGFLFNIKSQRW